MNARLQLSALASCFVLLPVVSRCSPDGSSQIHDGNGNYDPPNGLALSSFLDICKTQNLIATSPRTEKTIQMLRATFGASASEVNRNVFCSGILEKLQGKHLNLSGVANQYDLAIIAMAPLDSVILSNSQLTDADFARFVKGTGPDSPLRFIDVSENKLTHLIPLRPSKGFSRLERIHARSNELETVFLKKDESSTAECEAVNKEYSNPALADVTNELDLSANPRLLKNRAWAGGPCVTAHWSIFRSYWKVINVANTGISTFSFLLANEILRPHLFSLNIDGLDLSTPAVRTPTASARQAALTHLSARGTRNLPWDVLGKESRELPELAVLDLTGTPLTETEASLASDAQSTRFVIHPELAAVSRPGFLPNAETATQIFLKKAECTGEVEVEWNSTTCRLTRLYCSDKLIYQFDGETVQTLTGQEASVDFVDTPAVQPDCPAGHPREM